VGIAAPAANAGTNYRVTVTCTVPNRQPERQLASNWCLNYLPDGTQTFTAHVKDGSGHPVAGATVKWTDSDSRDARFRAAQNPCTTGSRGTCSAELADTHPRSGEKITVTATVSGVSAKGYLSFK
jgi:hypothetical protein